MDMLKHSHATPVEWRKRCFLLAYEHIGNMPPVTIDQLFEFWNKYMMELAGPDIFKKYDHNNVKPEDVLPIFYDFMLEACGEYI